MLQNVGLTGKFFKSLNEQNHRFISCYIIAICAEISQKANCFSKAGSIVIVVDLFSTSRLLATDLRSLFMCYHVWWWQPSSWKQTKVNILIKKGVIGFGKKNIDELKCGYSSDSEFARHLLSLEWRRRSVSKGALAVTAKFCKTKVEQGVCYTIL